MKELYNREPGSRMSAKDWKNTIKNTPARPRMEVDATFRLIKATIP